MDQSYLSGGFFSQGFWHTFGKRLNALLYGTTSFRYDFGFGSKDVKTVCQYYHDPATKAVLQQIITDEKLLGENDLETMRNIMTFVWHRYDPSIFYTPDQGERWNTPLETLASWNTRKQLLKDNALLPPGQQLSTYQLLTTQAWKDCTSTDCDDYAILIYNLSMTAGIPADDLYLCFMDTETGWHLNAQYFSDGVPYAIEGTYYPDIAIRDLGTVDYYENRVWNGTSYTYYYRFVKWLWNENVVRANNVPIGGTTMAEQPPEVVPATPDAPADNSKPFYLSKTLWFNVLSFLLIIAQLTELQGIIPAWLIPYETIAVALVNVGLRFITTGAISMTGAKK